MKNRDIRKIHFDIFDILEKYHKDNPCFKFRTRERGEEKFNDGWLFRGSTKYLEFTCWHGNIGKKRVYSISYFYSFDNNESSVRVLANNNKKEERIIFKRVSDALCKVLGKPRRNPDDKSNINENIFVIENKNYRKAVEFFVEKIRPIIDQIIIYYDGDIITELEDDKFKKYYLKVKQYRIDQNKSITSEIRKREKKSIECMQEDLLEKDRSGDDRYIDDVYNDISNISDESLIDKPIPATGLKKTRKKTYKRDSKQGKIALLKSKFKCECDNKHESFLKASNGKRYLEVHHLIPMAAQKDYKMSLDVSANIVALCSNCHNEIHYGKERVKLIKNLYVKRKNRLENVGIYITLEELIDYYQNL